MTQLNRTNEPMTVCRSSAGGPAVGTAAGPVPGGLAAMAAKRASLTREHARVVPGCGSRVSD